MLFHTVQYLIFLPAVVLVYYVLPKCARYLWLLAASYYFYMQWNKRYILLLFLCTCITYAGGLIIEKQKKTRMLPKTCGLQDACTLQEMCSRHGTCALLKKQKSRAEKAGKISLLACIILCRVNNWMVLFDGSLFGLGVGRSAMYVMLASIAALSAAGHYKQQGRDEADLVLRQGWLFQILVMLAMTAVILLYGCYGTMYDAQQFLYFQF